MPITPAYRTPSLPNEGGEPRPSPAHTTWVHCLPRATKRSLVSYRIPPYRTPNVIDGVGVSFGYVFDKECRLQRDVIWCESSRLPPWRHDAVWILDTPDAESGLPSGSVSWSLIFENFFYFGLAFSRWVFHPYHSHSPPPPHSELLLSGPKIKELPMIDLWSAWNRS